MLENTQLHNFTYLLSVTNVASPTMNAFWI